MRRRKKCLLAIMGLLLMLGTFSACGNQKGAPNTTQETSAMQKKSVKHRKKVSDAQVNPKKQVTIANRLKARSG